jgi:hypothetical protein
LFFSICTKIDPRFPNNYQIGDLWVNCDNGWNHRNNTFYKGYQENHCKITVDSAGAKIEHSIPRSFPLYYQTGTVTNLDTTLTCVWTDDAVTISHSGEITLIKSPLDLTVASDTLTLNEAKNQIRLLLDKKLTQVPDRVKLFCSGGIDTMLLYAMLDSVDLVQDEHYELDSFTQTNQSALDQFWGYRQIHHWTKPTWLATGSHGDEYFLRGPATIAMLTAWHNINFGELLINNPNCYHRYHFDKYQQLWKDSWNNRQQLQEEYPTTDALYGQILNILVNDYQHWHLGNTLTWTPFKDIDIARILLQCPIDELIPQFLDARLSRDLIIDYNPNIIDYISQYKNHNPQENLSKLFKFHAKSAGQNG